MAHERYVRLQLDACIETINLQYDHEKREIVRKENVPVESAKRRI